MSFLHPKEYYVNPEKLPNGLVQKNIFWIIALSALLILLLFKFPIQESLSGEVQIFHDGVPLSVDAKMNGELKPLYR